MKNITVDIGALLIKNTIESMRKNIIKKLENPYYNHSINQKKKCALDVLISLLELDQIKNFAQKLVKIIFLTKEKD